MKNVAGSGGKWLDVSAERLPGWIASFAVRHGVSDAQAGSAEALTVAVGDDHVSFTAQDGAVAQCYPPFPPAGGITALLEEVTPPARLDDPDVFDHPAARRIRPAGRTRRSGRHRRGARRPRPQAAHGRRAAGPPRRLRGRGVHRLPARARDAKVGSRLVHGRSAAGGWSQHRFARRREKQANEALSAAADAAVLIFGGWGTVRSTSQKRATTAAPRPTETSAPGDPP